VKKKKKKEEEEEEEEEIGDGGVGHQMKPHSR
jgi:hypothetical protein